MSLQWPSPVTLEMPLWGGRTLNCHSIHQRRGRRLWEAKWRAQDYTVRKCPGRVEIVALSCSPQPSARLWCQYFCQLVYRKIWKQALGVKIWKVWRHTMQNACLLSFEPHNSPRQIPHFPEEKPKAQRFAKFSQLWAPPGQGTGLCPSFGVWSLTSSMNVCWVFAERILENGLTQSAFYRRENWGLQS